MAPRPYSDKTIRTDSPNDVTSGIPMQNLPETPSPPTYSGATTPSPTPQEHVPIEPFIDTVVTREINRAPDFGGATPCYPTPGDIMPYDHSLPDFIRQITNQSNLANLHSLSLRVISTLISLHRMASYLPNLRYLDLEGSVLNSLRDIGCNLKNLQILKVGRCQLESLDGTFGLSSLRELYAQKNYISDVSPCSNLPHIRHIDVSGNRIRNISYAGFLSVCNKLKSIIFTGNPATQVPDYRKHVRRILPQLETLDGVPFINEENAAEEKELEITERYSEASDTSSTSAEVPDFSPVSPSDSLNNFLESEEDLFLLEKKNKQAKNLASQDQSVVPDTDIQELSPGNKENTDKTKITEIKSMGPKQKCASVLKLDKDNENRSKRTNLLSSEKFSEAYDLSSENSTYPVSENISASEEVLTDILSVEEKSHKPLTATGSTYNCSDDVLVKNINLGAIKKTTLPGVSISETKEKMIDHEYGEPSKLTKGLPVCGNLAAALRSRKKIMNAWDEKPNQRGSLTEEVQNERSLEADGIKKMQVQVNGSGDCFETELDFDSIDDNDMIEEDVLATSKKWREAFRRFRSNNRARWEEELESDFSKLLKDM